MQAKVGHCTFLSGRFTASKFPRQGYDRRRDRELTITKCSPPLAYLQPRLQSVRPPDNHHPHTTPQPSNHHRILGSQTCTSPRFAGSKIASAPAFTLSNQLPRQTLHSGVLSGSAFWPHRAYLRGGHPIDVHEATWIEDTLRLPMACVCTSARACFDLEAMICLRQTSRQGAVGPSPVPGAHGGALLNG